ncbi:MAG TPA: 16S rRNA processing protein RimM [Syntrophomonadaceae bacterium]|nr:16S rRNA processing protein RimM [Syntrophomonadaceae bacterium]
MESYITVGQISKPYGLRGEVRVIPYTDFPDRFLTTKRLFIRQNTLFLEKLVERAYIKDNRIIIKLAGINTPEEAGKFRGALLQVPPEEVRALPEGSYYYFQIVGLPVYTLDGKLIGKVDEILNTGSNDVYLVKDPEKGKEILLPATKEVIKKVDLKERCIVVNLLPGLLEE